MDDCSSLRSNTVVGIEATGGLPYGRAVLKKAQFIDLIQYLNYKLSFGGQSSVVDFDILLTVHLSIILATNQLNAQNLLL